MIFDQKERNDLGPAKQSDSHYSYLDRSARPEAQIIRNVMDEWISFYPVTEHPDFLAKLRSSNDVNFLSAFFELYLFTLMRKLNATDIAIETDIPNSNSHPDFFAKFPSNEKFYLEACCLSEAKDYLDQESTIDDIAERINNKLKGRNLGLSLQWDGNPVRTDFSSAKLKEIIKWYNGLSEDDVKNKIEINFDFDDWSIKFSTEGKIKSDHRVIHAVLPTEARKVTTDERLTSSLRYKGKRYGRLNEKFIIAINIVDGTYNHQVQNALFGQEAVEFNSHTREHRSTRVGNGFWRSEVEWIYTRVSAVIVAQKITPWNIFNARPECLEIYHHPFAEFPLIDSVLGRLPCYKVDKEKGYKLFPGEAVHDILNLPMSWL